MNKAITRRTALVGALLPQAGRLFGAGPVVIESHVHLFDPERVPYAPLGPYKPPAYPLEAHVKLVQAAGLTHSVVVHPEPYQDDHRYLEYAFAHEPSPGYFKGTCLFDPIREDTPDRIRALMNRWPKRLIAMRIHEVSKQTEATGPIRNRDMKDPRMLACWRAIHSMGLGIQMHFIPSQAPNIRALAEKFPDMLIILDHMGRPADGPDAEYAQVLKLSELPKVIMKFSGWDAYKGDLSQLTRRIYDAYGPDRMIWGSLGNTIDAYRKQATRFDQLLAFASPQDRDKIRGGNAQRLFFQ
jgi:predicted TIM-barrel fold metal-dependent hydrolase